MPSILPLVPSIPNYRVSTTLGDVQYILDVRWNTRAGAWYFDILTEDAVMIRAGMKVVLGALPGVRVRDTSFPDGLFSVIDLSGTHTEAALDDIGTRVQVWFYTADEVRAA